MVSKQMEKQRLDTDFFEKILIHQCLFDEQYLTQVIPFVDPSHFKNKDIKNVFTVIKTFYERRQKIPTITEIKSFLVNDTLKENFKNIIKEVKDFDRVLDKDELVSNTERFIKERAIYNTMLSVAEDFSQGNIDTAYILDSFERSCNVDLTTDIGLDLFKDIDRLIDDLNVDEPTITTGWDWLNNSLDGGFLQNGRSLYMFVGETNIGKSIVLGNVACNIAASGKNVLLISFEMAEMMYGRRLVSGLTKIPVRELKSQTVTLKHMMNEQEGQPKQGSIVVKEFPPNTVTVEGLQGYLKSVQSSGFKFDAIVLDYLNLIKGNENSQLYERIKGVSEKVRALSYIFSCPIITASQINRCLDINTVVKTPNGNKRIVDLKIGDKILGSKKYVDVRYVYPVETQKCYKIKLKSGKEIICSGKHMFPVSNQLVKSINTGLEVGDKLFTEK
jgi:replicative DNA helicase